MPYPGTGSSISLLDIQNEAGGSNPISLSEYYQSRPNNMIHIGENTILIGTSGSISLNNFRGGNQAKGYWGGGFNNGVSLTEIDGIRFTDETIVNPSAALSVGRDGGTGLSNASNLGSSSNRGYFVGGFAEGSSTVVDRFNFVDETCGTGSYNLSAGRHRLGDSGINMSSRGVVVGGYRSQTTTYQTIIDGIYYSSNESYEIHSISLSEAKGGVVSASLVNAGIAMRGEITRGISFSTVSNYISSLITMSTLSLTIYGRGYEAGFNRTDYSGDNIGYFAGGTNGGDGVLGMIDRYNHDNGTFAEITAGLSPWRSTAAGVNADTYSCIGGGFLGIGSYSSSIVKVTHSSESLSTLSAALVAARSSLSGIQAGRR